MTNRIGDILKEARSKRQVTLEEVHSKIKIHPRVLQLLEEGKFEKLPSPLFAKSFLKSYAEFLEINPEELLQEFEKAPSKEPDQVIFIRTADERVQKPLLHEIRGVLFWITAALAIGIGLYYGWGWAQTQFKEISFLKPKASVSVVAPKQNTKQNQKPKTPAEAPKSKEWLRSAGQGNYPAINRKTPLELKLKAVDKVWLRVTVDGKVLFQSILEKGAVETWKAKQSIEIWTGNSSNMALTLNNYFLGSPGKGVIKKLAITHDGVKIIS